MAPEEEDLQSPDETDEFVPAVFSRSRDEAELFRELLNDHDIPAIIGTEENVDDDRRGSEMTHGVPVLVPDVLLDEASEIIADRDDSEEFDIEGDEAAEGEDDDQDETDFGFGPADEFDEAGVAFDDDEDDEDDLWLDDDDDDEDDDAEDDDLDL